jgi:hypothetical protein
VTVPLVAPAMDDRSGWNGRAEHRCAACGYGIIVSDPVPVCPMCQTNAWHRVAREPFAHADRPGAVVDELAARRLRRPS